jgi:hypothetical protein
VKILLVIRACVQVHRQQIAGWNAGAGGVKLKLADRDSGAVRAEIAQAEYPAAVGDANEANILVRPVSENLLHPAAALDGQIHPAGLTINVSELEACLTDGGVVYDRKKPGGVRHDGPIKESFIVIEQVDQVNVSLQICVLLAELEHHTLQLKVLALGYVRQKTDQTKLFLFGIRKGRRFIQPRIPEKFHSALL